MSCPDRSRFSPHKVYVFHGQFHQEFCIQVGSLIVDVQRHGLSAHLDVIDVARKGWGLFMFTVARDKKGGTNRAAVLR